MNKKSTIAAVVYAILAAVFYAISVPCSKMLLPHVPPVFMAAFLYIGAGVGVGCMYIFKCKRETPEQRLSRADLPYTVGMVLLDIAAPILLMLGVKYGTSSDASLLGNFEIVATALIALLVFKEPVSWRLWTAIALVTASSIILSYEGGGGFSVGSLFVLGATVCWGLENNCTRRISDKSTYQIVTIKGFGSGFGALAVAFVTAGADFEWKYVPLVLMLGFVAYGLSVFTYVRAQNTLGAAKTSAYYSIAPFIGAFLAFVILGEALSQRYLAALLVMIAGTVFIVCDTLILHHTHQHTHTVTQNGITHTIVHSHPHNHFGNGDSHTHWHRG